MKIDPDDIVVRSFEEKDVPLAAFYWSNPSENTIYPYLAESAHRSFDQWSEALLQHARSPESRKLSAVVQYQGETIGSFGLSDVNDQQADIHAHLWVPQVRSRGIGYIAGLKAALFLMDLNNLCVLFLRPPIENHLSSGLAKKYGFRKIATQQELKYKMIKPGVFADVYEANREDVERALAKLID